MKNTIFRTGLFAALAILIGCGGGEEAASGDAAPGGRAKKLSVAYVTNGIDPFWTIAEAGVVQAGKDLGVNVEVLMPPKGLADQKRMIEGLLARGTDGIAISPIDAANQVEFINEACRVTNVITQDSDAPGSNRLCFIGMDNYKAGRECGKLIKEAMPQGGSVMIFVGRLEQLNAQQRRQGVIDEILDRPVQDVNTAKFDAPDFTDDSGKYKILGTRTDNFDYAKAKSNAEDAMATYPNLGCMVGLFAYNVPNCISAIKEAGKLGKIKIASFDEADDTLEGIREGYVQGTVSQQPYVYGYKSVEVLKALAEGDKSVIPENKFIEISTVVVRKDNVDDFWAKLKKLKGGK